jgi:hypothetical protein
MAPKKEEEKDQTVKVMLRVRPLITREIEAKQTCNRITYDSKTEISIEAPNDRGRRKYTFHEVYPPGTRNAHVYETYAKDAVEAAFKGYHGVLFVYGQTASGKTHTISCDDDGDKGMLQQSMFEVWDTIQNDKTATYNCTLSYVEIYNEQVTDLLAEKERDRPVRLQTATFGEVIMLNENTGQPVGVPVQSYQDTMKYFRKGQNMKAMAATSMNDRSSRSHTIFSLDIEKSTRVIDPTKSGEAKNLTALKGRLVLCDLAGSERVAKTKAEGATLKEAAHINSSLLVLGNVVKALTDKKVQHAPFRESKLTRILQYSLSGHGKTAIIVTISPSDENTDESLSAIAFGQRAILIKQQAQKHEIRDYQALYLALQTELDRRVDDGIVAAVSEERRLAEEKMEQYVSRINVLEAENKLLMQENTDLRAGKNVPPRRVDPNAGVTTSVGTQELLKAASESSTFQTAEWNKIAQGLISKVKELSEQLQNGNNERHQLREKLRAEESKCFSLGIRFRDVLEESIFMRRDLEREMNDLRAQVAASQGTEFLAPTLPQDRAREVDLDTTPQPVSPAQSPLDPNNPTAVSSKIIKELSKAQEEVNILKKDIAELLVYQRLAADAIVMLYHDKNRLAAQLGKSS